jgi:hypothetical protein
MRRGVRLRGRPVAHVAGFAGGRRLRGRVAQVAGQLGSQRRLDHPAGKLRQRPARTRDLRRLEALERPAGNNSARRSASPSGSTSRIGFLLWVVKACPLPARPPRSLAALLPGSTAPNRSIGPQYRSRRPHTEHRTEPSEGHGAEEEPNDSLIEPYGIDWRQSSQHCVCNEHQIVVAAELKHSPDFGHLEPMVTAAERELTAAGVSETPRVVVADAGYWHHDQMDDLAGRGITVLVPLDADKRKAAGPGRDGGRYAFIAECSGPTAAASSTANGR